MMVDANIILAMADREDRVHALASAIMARTETKIVTDAILAEADCFIRARVGHAVEMAFLESVDDAFVVEPSTRKDRARARELCERYGAADLGYADALTVAIAERLGEHVIATLDRRDFAMIRPKHVAAFELIP